MAMQASEVSHDHGITREIYEVSRQYADACQRLKTVGTDQDAISEDFYRSAMKVYVAALITPDVLAQMSGEMRRETLCNLATIALRWARKARIG